MLISEIKTVLTHHVPFLRNRELMFHETVIITHNYLFSQNFNTTEDLCWCFVVMG